MNKEKQKENIRAYVYTTLLMCIVISFLIWKLQIYPFGNHDLRYADNDQYFAYNSYLQQTLFSNSDFLYSFSNVLGGEAISTFAYYASSPLHFMLVFFKNDYALGISALATV